MVKYAARVEDLFSQVANAGVFDRKQRTHLKTVFYERLNPELKIASAFKLEAVHDNNSFTAEIRNLESELKLSRKQGHVTSCISVNQKVDDKSCCKDTKKSEMGEVKTLLEQMSVITD